MNEVMRPSDNCNSGDGERVISIPKNTRAMSRTFTFYVEDSADRFHKCYVTQLANGTVVDTDTITFTVSPTEIDATPLETTQKVQITSSTADGYTISTPSWVIVTEKTDTYFVLSIALNTSNLPRFGSVSVTAYAEGKDDIEVGIPISQKGNGVRPSPLE